MDDGFYIAIIIILGLSAWLGWGLFSSSQNTMEDMVTTLPNGCILYEDKIYCEEVSE